MTGGKISEEFLRLLLRDLIHKDKDPSDQAPKAGSFNLNLNIIHFFPILYSIPPENIIKLYVFLMFPGG